MAEYLDFYEPTCTTDAIHHATLGYVLDECHSIPDITSPAYRKFCGTDDATGLLQSWFDKSPIKMRMYGSAKELVENVKIYRDFPGSHSYFGEQVEPYFTTPTIYKNLKNRKFIRKSDIYPILHHMTVRFSPSDENCVFVALIKYFLKSREARADEYTEFVPLDRKIFSEILDEILQISEEIDNFDEESFEKLSKVLENVHSKELIKKFNNYIPFNWSFDDEERMAIMFPAFEEQASKMDSGISAKATFFVDVSITMRELLKIIKKRPEMFLPHSETKDNKLPITVRLFEDGDQKYVMKAELFNALKIEYKEEEFMFGTLSMEDVLEKYGKDIGNIEFIRYPIQRTKHRAVLLHGFDPIHRENYCVPALDSLFEFLRICFFEVKTFQRCKVPLNLQMFVLFQKYFLPDYEAPYFMRIHMHTKIRESTHKTVVEFENCPMRDIRDVKPIGFTVQDLKDELQYLNLTRPFPEIQRHAEVVYAHVDKVKREEVLRTCDLMDALEYCQLICFFERLPTYKRFLHNQGGCGRVPGLVCVICAAKEKPDYLDHCESVLFPYCLHTAALHYIPNELRTNPDLSALKHSVSLVKDKGEALFQLMFDKSPTNMRVYGSSKELTENIKIYMSFPGSLGYFDLNRYPFFSTPTIYRSLKNQKFIAKSDLFVMLQSMIARASQLPQYIVMIKLTSIFLKSQEKRVGGHIEFVPFDQQVFDSIWNKIKNTPISRDECAEEDEFWKFHKEVRSLDIDGVMQKLKSTVLSTWNDKEEKDITSVIKTFHSSPNFASFIAHELTRVGMLIEVLQESINASPEMFLPHSETKDNKLPITIRMFEDGDQKFVMKAELFNVMKSDCGFEIDEDDGRVKFETMKMEDVLRQYGSKLKDIEFIRYPIQRAKHRAVPINGSKENNFCITAVDALFEYLNFMFFEIKLFQRYDDWSLVEQTFLNCESIFVPDIEVPYFMNVWSMIRWRSECRNHSDYLFGYSAKEIRNAKPDGFTVQDLKSELVYLEITQMFPDIQDHAEVVYAYVDSVKKEKFLRTCDLIDALEYCQLICFFERLPNYKKFLHNQGGCGRVPGLKCDFCVKINSSKSASTKVTPSESQIKEIEQLKIKISALEAENSQLKMKHSSEISKLRNELKMEEEKSKKIEDDLVKKAKELLEIEVGNIKLNAENEANKKIVEQLLQKFSKFSIGSNQ